MNFPLPGPALRGQPHRRRGAATAGPFALFPTSTWAQSNPIFPQNPANFLKLDSHFIFILIFENLLPFLRFILAEDVDLLPDLLTETGSQGFDFIDGGHDGSVIEPTQMQGRHLANEG